MIIYYLDNDAKKCAEYLSDADLSKQIKAIAQCLCNVHHLIYAIPLSKFANGKRNDNIPLPAYKFGNDYDKWASICKANYLKLVDMGLACCEEYIFRHVEGITQDKPFIKQHKLQSVIEWAASNIPDLPQNSILTCNLCRGTKKQIKYAVDYKHIGSDCDCPAENQEYFDTETYLPITIPVEYWVIEDPFPVCDLIESHRNYYRAKYHKKMLAYLRDDSRKLKKPAWTRREKPEWLNDK